LTIDKGSKNGKLMTIAYLAPEIPALSATFVYEELLGLERRGISVMPISVHRPLSLAHEQTELACRVNYLYELPKLKLILFGLVHLVRFKGFVKAMCWLVSDLFESGLLRLNTWKLVFQFLVAVKVAAILKKQNCIHLHVHFAHVPAQIAMYASALSGVPFTIMAHANDIFERGNLLQRKAERAAKMLTISEYNCDYLRNIGVGDDKLAVVRCGVSFTSPEKATILRDDAKYRIGTLGRLVEKKGVDVLIRAINELRDKPYGVELVIAGDGPLHNELVKLVKELDQTDVVRFIGSIPHNEVQAWIKTLDIFVLACKQDSRGDMDGIPVSLMEAMSQGVPVISSRISGIPELIIDNETGLLVEPDNYHDLAHKIDQLLSSPEQRKTLAAGALKHVDTEFSQGVNLDRLIEHFGLLASDTISL
jgi:colanic acid/amylovoran biosynthesis glycosyltransferase